MAKWINDDALDALLDYVEDSDRLYICSQQPATYTEATSTYSLGYVAVDSGDFAQADDVSGRKTTVAQQSVTPSADGSVNHVALVKTTGSILKYVTTCPSKTVASGVAETVAAFTINPQDVI